MHRLVPSEHRASVISFDAMVGNGGGILGQSALGYVSRSRSIASAYVVGGLATLVVLPLVALLRRSAPDADRFSGLEAGAHGPCAAQGVPEITQVDASTVTETTRARVTS